MASKGRFAKPPEWWKHLRPYGKKRFWSSERMKGNEELRDEVDEALDDLNPTA